MHKHKAGAIMADEILKIALVPAYKPAQTMLETLRELNDLGFVCVTVNDGSGEDYDAVFAEAAALSTVLVHNMNLGKGAALKTGLCHIQANFREPYVVVTLDADGQHSVFDALRAAEAAAADPDALVLGCRAFKGEVPLKSRLGNGITKAVFALISGKKVSDTQTGLRAFSHRQVSFMLDIKGDRYEYEMNVLMEYARAGKTISEVPIETIYIDGNASSHFRPVRDSYRIYKEIIKFSLSSLVGFAVDYALFCILSALTGQTALANIGARIVSATVNFEINRRVVFKSRKSVGQSALGYFTLALFIMICGTALVTLLTEVVGINAYLAKILTESSMFILSWSVQRTTVFADNGQNKGGTPKMDRRKIWAVGYGAALALFTGYVMLDTFIIPTVNVADASAINMAMFENAPTEAVKSETGTDGSESRRQSSSAEKRTPPEKPSGSESTSDSSRKTRPSGEHRSKSSDTSGKGGSGNKSGTESKTRSGSGKSSKTLTTSESSDGKSYSDENISVNISEYNENSTRIYVADVTLSSAQYLKTAFAGDSYGKNITALTSETAEAKNAVLAINGDYYGARESGYVIRNGVIYRSTGSSDTDVLCIYTDGHFGITNSSEKTTEELLAEGVWQAFSFGPALVENSEIAVSENEEVGRAKASNPRTAIGIIDDLHYVFVVADGRTSESTGLSLSSLAAFMKDLGCTTAYNLDGGGSSTMYFGGEVINNPTTSGNSINERKVSDIVYIG